MTKYVFSFKEGNKEMRDILGGKGANLAEMTNLGLPVPSGFVVSTEACNLYYKENKTLPVKIEIQIMEKLKELEKETNKRFGDLDNPLLLSIRSGGRVSMPGMMDTILNLGLNDEIVKRFSETTKNSRFVYDLYRRFIQMYAEVVRGFSKNKFDAVIEKIKKEQNIVNDDDLTAQDFYEIAMEFKAVYKDLSSENFPDDPKVQLLEAIKAVFNSWNNERAIIYREMNNISADWGTAVNVQSMVYGNKGDDCGTGVAFTRNPSTGENKLYGEYLINAQGEDVVAGIRTPESIDTLKIKFPKVYDEFQTYCKKLEEHYKDMQDLEFTVEHGKLYILQTRDGKRTVQAALKIAVDLVNESLITKEEAILKIQPNQLEQLLHPTFLEKDLKGFKSIAKGLPASPGGVSGKIYFYSKDIVQTEDEDTILVRLETSPEDIQGMIKAKGILTIRGGMTSHAAVVARGMGRTCIVGCSDLIIDLDKKRLITKDGTMYNEGDYISIDGTTGFVYEGKIKSKNIQLSDEFLKFMKWTDEVKDLEVRVNADTVIDAKQALKFGAEGIGLCRTEHMFFNENRILEVQKMILAKDKDEAINNLLPMQRSDFEQLFEVMNGFPVTIRYLDPPLHEFLPTNESDFKVLANDLNMEVEEIKQRVASLEESNPMMGHRGCRIAITYPEILIMQTRAIIEAAINVSWLNVKVKPELMIPLIVSKTEFNYLKDIIQKTANEVMLDLGVRINYKVGSMIETPRASILSDEIAPETDFFSFGTNDLTQLVYGFSRDDVNKFLPIYYNKKILLKDPFFQVDEDGVGRLVEMSVIRGRSSNKDLELGVCGEHGGEPNSIMFFHKIGLDYVSCSPFRVPIARLAAAQAKLKEG